MFAAYLNGQEDTRNIPWLDLHGHIKVKTHTELSEGHEVTALRAKESASLDLFRAGNDIDVLDPAPGCLVPTNR